jgi:pimeloyl-ACP methyl ester carboxylesterase
MQILLVHGLGRTPFSLFGLASELRRNGHRTRFFGYLSTFEMLTSIVRRLTQRLRALAIYREPIGLIGHSLGGLLLRMALQKVPEIRVYHFVMLGTPNQSPRMARLAWRWLPFRLFSGSCGRFLAAPSEFLKLASLTVPHTVVAGTGGLYGRLSPFGYELNDGLVSVSEATINNHDEVLPMPVWHSTMMDAVAVRKQIVAIMNRKDLVIHLPI